MLVQLAFAFGLAAVTVIVHAVGSWQTIAHLMHARKNGNANPGVLRFELQIVRVVSLMLLLHLIEAAIWATFYRMTDVLPDFETALYFSITSYTTMGYGDVVLAAPRRLLGPIEGAVGILMFGWSTAIVVATITRLLAVQMPLESRD